MDHADAQHSSQRHVKPRVGEHEDVGGSGDSLVRGWRGGTGEKKRRVDSRLLGRKEVVLCPRLDRVGSAVRIYPCRWIMYPDTDVCCVSCYYMHVYRASVFIAAEAFCALWIPQRVCFPRQTSAPHYGTLVHSAHREQAVATGFVCRLVDRLQQQ